MLRRRIDTETRLRALALTMALTAFKIEHGHYPEQLADLPDAVSWAVDGDPDPWTGRPFNYQPHGFPTGLSSPYVAVPAQQPFLQSPAQTEFPVEFSPRRNRLQEPVLVHELRSGWNEEFVHQPNRDWNAYRRAPLIFPLP